jgi:hypothetical protein
VQCQACFQNSNHEGHEVFFHRTGVGGCCDCGDVEAWAESGFCTRHGRRPAAAAAGDMVNLPLAVKLPLQRGVFRDALQYVTDTVVALRESLDAAPLDTEEQWNVVILNDDVHTYEEVGVTAARGVVTSLSCAPAVTVLARVLLAAIVRACRADCTCSRRMF